MNPLTWEPLTVLYPWAPRRSCSLSIGARGSSSSLFYVHGPPRVLLLTDPCNGPPRVLFLFLVHGPPRVFFLTVLCPWAPRVLFLIVPCTWASEGLLPHCFLSMGPEGLISHCSLSMGPRGSSSSLFYVHGPPRVFFLTILCPWVPEGLLPHCSMSMGPEGLLPHCSMSMGPRRSSSSLFYVHGSPTSAFYWRQLYQIKSGHTKAKQIHIYSLNKLSFIT